MLPAFSRGDLGSRLYLRVVLGVRSDPTPEEPAVYFRGESAIVQPDAHRPVLADFLEVKRRVTWILDEYLEVGFCELLNV